MTSKESRVFSIKEQLRHIYYGAKGFVLLKTSKKKKLMTKQMKERIMLAITEVNGCTMCSFVHTRLALQSGMPKEQIQAILNGNTNDVPLEEAVAVIFGQNFAYSKEEPSIESISRLVEDYGIEKAEVILAACNMITMTNGMGTSMDYFYNRLRFKRYKKSNIISEILNPLLTMLLFPLFVGYFYLYQVFSRITFINRKKLIAN